MAVNLKEELQKLKAIQVSKEELYNLSEFEEKLQVMNVEEFETSDLIIFMMVNCMNYTLMN